MCLQKNEEGKGFLPKDPLNISIDEHAKLLLPTYRDATGVAVPFALDFQVAEVQNGSNDPENGRLVRLLHTYGNNRQLIVAPENKRWVWFPSQTAPNQFVVNSSLKCDGNGSSSCSFFTPNGCIKGILSCVGFTL